MTEAKNHMPLFQYNSLLSPNHYKISEKIIPNVSKQFFQLDCKSLANTKPLSDIQNERETVLQLISKDRALLSEDELLGLSLATLIAPSIDLIYYNKLKENNDELIAVSKSLREQMVDLLDQPEYANFFKKYPPWRSTLDLIRTYAFNQFSDKDDSNNINKESTRVAKEMGAIQGPKLFFLPEEENEKLLKDQVEKKTFVPQLLFTLPVDENAFKHPLGLKNTNIFYGFVMLQAGSALKWEQSALAIDGGALFLVNNFVGNYESVITRTLKAAQKHRIDLSEENIWQIFVDLLLLHEIGHSIVYSKIDEELGTWTEWLANSFMYVKALKLVFEKKLKDKVKIIFMLMAHADLNKERVDDKAANKYIDSEILFLHLLLKSGLVNFTESTFSLDKNNMFMLKDLIIKCRELKNIKKEQAKIDQNSVVQFWKNYFEGNDK